MKKKVALLLALVMVMSLLPMNLFGNTAGNYSVTGGLTGANTSSGAAMGISFPFAALQGTSVLYSGSGANAGMYESKIIVEFTAAYINGNDIAAMSTNANQVGLNPPASWAGGEQYSSGRVALSTWTTTVLNGPQTLVTNPQERAIITANEHDYDSWGKAYISIFTAQPITPATPGFVVFQLPPVRGWDRDNMWLNATLSVRTNPEATGATHTIIPPWSLATAGVSSVAWSVAGPRGFDSALHVPAIRLAENRFGVISGAGNVVRLIAPQYYTWSFYAPGVDIVNRSGGNIGNIVSGRTGINDALRIMRGGVGGGESFQTMAAPIARIDTLRTTNNQAQVNQPGISTHRHEIFINLGNIQRNNAWAPGLGFIEIENLWLIPDDHAQNVGNVMVTVEYGTFGGNENPVRITVPGAGDFRFVRTAVNYPAVGRIVDAGQSAELHVGTRGSVGLSVDVHDGPRDIRTGHLGNWRNQDERTWQRNDAGETNWIWNRDNEGLPHWTGVATSTLIIEETIPGGFVYGFGGPINFEFLLDGQAHPGIKILGVEARAGNIRNYMWSRGELNNFHRDNTGVPPTNGWPHHFGANQNWMTFSGWLSALNLRVPNVAGVGRLSDKDVTLYLPSQTITDASHNLRLPGLLEVRFYLSLEAGYQAKYGDDVTVTITGAGVTHLPGGTATAVVAHAQDPMRVTHETPVSLNTGTLYNVMGYQALDNIEIEVVNDAAFQVGDELWLYIATDAVGRNYDMNIATIPHISINAESGLRMDTGRLGNPQLSLGGLRDAIVFTVTRQPYGGDAPAPVITISNLFVEGQAWPGIEYHLVVSGTAVADNDQEVYHRSTQLRTVLWEAEAAIMRNMNRGVFTTLPYPSVTLENSGSRLDDFIDAPGPFGGNGRIAFTVNTMYEVDGALIQAVAFPEVAPGIVSSMMNPRVFAEYVGAERVWDDAARTFTFTGVSAQGVPQTVVLTLDSPTIVVNGQSHDIATLAEQPMLVGRIYPQVIGGRQYVPVRVLANIFGVPVAYEPGTVILG